jgi:hypothetical protein
MQKSWYIALNKIGVPQIMELTAIDAQGAATHGPFATIEEAQRQFALAFPKPDWR